MYILTPTNTTTLTDKGLKAKAFTGYSQCARVHTSNVQKRSVGQEALQLTLIATGQGSGSSGRTSVPAMTSPKAPSPSNLNSTHSRIKVPKEKEKMQIMVLHIFCSSPLVKML